MLFNPLKSYRDAGLLIIRLGVGFGFIWFLGLPKFTTGETALVATGSAMRHFGITGGYYWWGVAAALAESLGALFLALGLAFRPAMVAMVLEMTVATIEQFTRPMPVPAHSFNNAFVFAGLFLTGPGRYSLDYLLAKRFGPARDTEEERTVVRR